MNNPRFVFFGTPDIAVTALEELINLGLIPTLVVTGEDKPQQRRLEIKPTPVALCAQQNQIPTLKPSKLKDIESQLKDVNADFFLVVAYGKILPSWLLDIPHRKVLNIHPSLLPLYRGPSPIESALLDGVSKTGVTLMELDEEMDHGRLIAQKEIEVTTDTTKAFLYTTLAKEGVNLLKETLTAYLDGTLTPHEQDHAHATYSRKFTKEDGQIDPHNDKDLTTWNKWRAFKGWPGLYFFDDNVRVKITDAVYANGTFTITKVIPEGRKEISYTEYLQ